MRNGITMDHTRQPDLHRIVCPSFTHTARSFLTSACCVAIAPSPPYADLKSQKAFEKGLLEKTAKQTGDIILYDNRVVLYKSESDVMMYVVGSVDENEIMLYNVILALRDSLHLIFKYAPLLRTIPGNYMNEF